MAEEPTAGDKLARLASAVGNLSEAMDDQLLTEIAEECITDYEQDKADRKEWTDTAQKALDVASQKKTPADKDYPWKGSSNIHFPILTEACLQFNARMYPAVIKGDEAILCKVIGQDSGRPVMAPHPQTGKMMPMPMMAPNPQTGQMEPVAGPDGQIQPMWEVEPGAKAKRARRVSEYLNTVIFYRMTNWESDTDSLLMQLPATGCVFRKCWWDFDRGQPKTAMIPALRVFVPKGTTEVETAERLTEEIPDVSYRTIISRQRSGFYAPVDICPPPVENKPVPDEVFKKPRLLLEQHRYLDLDEDGLGEPYIVTVDHESRKVLRVEPNFGPDDVLYNNAGEVVWIEKGKYYVKYGLFPHPDGGFYDIGLGHLLEQLGEVINTALNQLMDAGTAQTAGGGFIGSGVRLQGGKSGVVRINPGEYKTVPVSGSTLREAIVERTLPNVSPVTLQVLDLIMGAAKDIAGAKDVITGDASNTGQVGTTLALIEQGLQVFNATAKRVFRSLKDEFTLLKANVGNFGGEKAAQDYGTILDDPEANFEADFAEENMDIRTVSDPSTVTKMQKLAKAQFVMGTMQGLAAVGGDPREALKRAFEAADVEDIDKLLPPPQPQQPDPRMVAQIEAVGSKALKDKADAGLKQVQTEGEAIQNERDKLAAAMEGMLAGMGMGAVNAPPVV